MSTKPRPLTNHVAAHSNAESEVHAQDKLQFRARNFEARQENAVLEDHEMVNEAILRVSGLDSLSYQRMENHYFRYWQNEVEEFAHGNDYERYILQERDVRTHYQSPRNGQTRRINPKNAVIRGIITLHPAHSAYLRTVAPQRQLGFIRRLLPKAGEAIEGNTRWMVLAFGIHDDSSVLHIDFIVSRYSDPVPAIGRGRVDACRLLGNHKGLCLIGITSCAFFRYSADGYAQACKPGLDYFAVRNLEAHRRRYKADPLDLVLTALIDEEVRAEFALDPNFNKICSLWYEAKASLTRKGLCDQLQEYLARHAVQPGIDALSQGVEAYSLHGLQGVGKWASEMSAPQLNLDAELERVKQAHVSELAAVKQSNVELSAALDSVIAEAHMLAESEERLRSELQEAVRLQTSAEGVQAQLVTEREKMKREVAEATAKNQKLDHAFKSLWSQLAEEQKRTTSKTELAFAKGQRIIELLKERESLNQQLTDAHRMIDQLRASTTPAPALAPTSSSAYPSRPDLENGVAKRDAQIGKLRQDLEAAKNELALIRQKLNSPPAPSAGYPMQTIIKPTAPSPIRKTEIDLRGVYFGSEVKRGQFIVFFSRHSPQFLRVLRTEECKDRLDLQEKFKLQLTVGFRGGGWDDLNTICTKLANPEVVVKLWSLAAEAAGPTPELTLQQIRGLADEISKQFQDPAQKARGGISTRTINPTGLLQQVPTYAR